MVDVPLPALSSLSPERAEVARQRAQAKSLQAEAHRRRRRTWIVAVIAVIAVVTAGIFWPGYDVKDAPPENVEVWALRTDAQKYGRINTQIGELGTTKPVSNPSTLIQTPDTTVIFTDGNQKFAILDPALPANLGEDQADALLPTPPTTVLVEKGGEALLYTAADRTLSSASLTHPGNAITVVVPADKANADAPQSEGEEKEQSVPFEADAAAISPDDTIVAYAATSPSEGRIITVDARTGQLLTDQLVEVAGGEAPQIALVNNRWVLLAPEDGRLWSQGVSEPITLDLDASPLLRSSGEGDIFVADAGGLLRVSSDGAQAQRIVDTPSASRPAQPTEIGGDVFAAWLAPGNAGGTLWQSGTEETTTLSYGDLEMGEEISPQFLSNGSHAILNDTRSGWVWTLPQGELVPSSQNWTSDDIVVEETIDAEVKEVTEPRPPVAQPDAFGVRAGSTVALPVLLNDHDPNLDVLSVAPDSVSELDPTFGVVHLANDLQQPVVTVAPGASGSATFTYEATDGTAADGLNSAPATVTLTVIPEDQNQAPVWCGTENCLGQWPSPTVAPGATISIQVLSDWVDPDGDQFFLEGAVNGGAAGEVITHPDGTLTYRHPDPNQEEAQSIPIDLTVSDTRGATSVRTLIIQVTPEPTLTFDSTVVTGVTDTPLDIDVADLVTGGRGGGSIVDVVPESSGGSEGLTIQGSTGLSFTALGTQPGSYPVKVTVEEGNSEVTGTVRVILLDPEQAQVSTVPVTVFIRPSEDTTVDIMPTVQNPAGHVLLVSSLHYTPEPDAELTANVINEHSIHAMGTTASGQPGKIGEATYRVFDGTSNPRGGAIGTITFMLLPEADSSPPIARDQWVTIAAGTQVDIPVLDVATGAAGSKLAIDQGSIVNDQEMGLAFATSTLVRYLAPDDPGEYTVGYTIFRLGDPSLTSSARIHITVVPADTENTPQPPTLQGRALAGTRVSIPLEVTDASLRGETFGLDAVLTQPLKGTAAISADEESIIYTANPGAEGQDSFTYQVRTPSGKMGTGTVRMGILDEAASPQPVTLTNYLQMTVGAENKVSVFPAATDIDPAGDPLEVVEVWPNAAPGTDEYRALEKRILSFDEETGEVILGAGDELGTSSFLYTVRSARADTATGLIVTKVVRERIPDLPVVTDTRITAETLGQMPAGVDVLTDKTTWFTGSVDDLELSMWREDSPYRAVGTKIAGPIPEEFTVVPFVVSGTSFTDEAVTSYGFLKIPSAREVALALRADSETLEVKEGESAEIDLTEAVAAPQGATLEFDAAQVRTSGARANATCALSGTTLTYGAGEGAPWRDTCTFAVKTAGQENFTFLTIAIHVIAQSPTPELHSATLTLSPGDTETYNLEQMVTWEGEASQNPLQFQIATDATLFDVVPGGNLLTITAHDDAQPTLHQQVTVSLLSHPEVAPATLTLVVGPAPQLLPKGGTVTHQCSQARGTTSCTIPVLGATGQVNPLPNTPLKVVGAVSPANCPAVSFAVSGESIVASWAPDAPGMGNCTGSFLVEDGQRRQATGTIILDLQGLPVTPASAVWTAYSDSSVTIQVTSVGESYPAITGYRYSGGGLSGTCPANGQCAISGLTLGARTEFEFRAVNSVGESLGAASVAAWTYRSPDRPSLVEWRALPAGGASITIGVNPEGTKQLRVTGAVDQTVEVGGNSQVTFTAAVPPLPSQVIVTPVSAFEVPPIAGGSADTPTLQVDGVYSMGAPEISLGVSQVGAGKTMEATVQVLNPNGVTGSRSTQHVRICGGSECYEFTGGSSVATMSFPVEYGQTVTFTAEAWGTFEGSADVFPRGSAAPVTKTATVPGLGALPGYVLAGDSAGSAGSAGPTFEWRQITEPVVPTPPTGLTLRYGLGGFTAPGSEFTTVQAIVNTLAFGDPLPAIYVANCAGSTCSDPSVMSPSGVGPTSLGFTKLTGEKCARDPKTSPYQASDFLTWASAGWAPNIGTPSSVAPTPTDPTTHTWTFSLPSGLTANGAGQLSWSCWTEAPTPSQGSS